MSDNPTCQGCGKAVNSLTACRATLAPGAEVRLCASARSSERRYPKLSCLAAARNKLRPCPGCGAELAEYQWLTRAICEECSAVLERQRALGEPKPVRWVAIDAANLFGDYLATDEKEARDLSDRLAGALARCFGRWQPESPVGWPAYDAESVVPHPDRSPHSVGGYRTTGMVYVEVDEVQAAALRDLGAGIAAMGQVQFERGKNRGHSLLARLASGEVTVSAYEEQRGR